MAFGLVTELLATALGGATGATCAAGAEAAATDWLPARSASTAGFLMVSELGAFDAATTGRTAFVTGKPTTLAVAVGTTVGATAGAADVAPELVATADPDVAATAAGGATVSGTAAPNDGA